MYFGIVGSGFGIYGWLSALTHFSQIKIATLSRYKEQLTNRLDIQNVSLLKENIKWFDEEDLLFQNIDVLIIAKRPIDQVEIIKKLIKQSWKGSLIIEKPIAHNPHQAKNILKQLVKNKIFFQVGFSIMETDWSQKIQQLILDYKPKQINIDWDFHAHHYKQKKISWKSDPKFGGGALNFYCIHFIAWLSSFSNWNVNYCSPLKNKNDDSNVNFQLSNNYTILTMKCNSMNEKLNQFKITKKNFNSRLIYNLNSPFSENAPKKNTFQNDERVPYLIKIIERSIKYESNNYSYLKRHIALWEQIEIKRYSY